VNLVSEALDESPSRAPGVRLVVEMDHQRRIPKFELEDIEGSEQAAADDHAALAEARERGGSRAAEILVGGAMLSPAEFAKFHRRFARGSPCQASTTRSSRSQWSKTRTPFSEMAVHL
jgi:hypothetical protein